MRWTKITIKSDMSIPTGSFYMLLCWYLRMIMIIIMMIMMIIIMMMIMMMIIIMMMMLMKQMHRSLCFFPGFETPTFFSSHIVGGPWWHVAPTRLGLDDEPQGPRCWSLHHSCLAGYVVVFPCENFRVVSAGSSMVAGNLSWLPRRINTLLAKSTRKGQVP